MRVIYYVFGHVGKDGLEYIVRGLYLAGTKPSRTSDISTHRSMDAAQQAIASLARPDRA